MAKASEARVFRALLRRNFPAFVRKVFATLRVRPSVRAELAP